MPEPGTDSVCAGLVAALPEVVDDAVRRDVSLGTDGADGASATVAAWGQPPIILRCGVAEPTGVDPTFAVLEVAGVRWRAVPGDGGTFFYTADRVAVVEVGVPSEYAPEGDVLVDLAPAVRDTVPADT